MLNSHQNSQFNQRIEELNGIIADDNLLEKSFDDFVITRKKMVMSIFASYHNRYLNAAANRSWIPYLLRDGEVKALENYIMCESHRDVVNRVLSSLNNNKNV